MAVKHLFSADKCEHEAFESTSVVTRLSDVDGGPITGYCAELTVICCQCGTHFLFPQVTPVGSSWQHVTTSVDYRELRIPLRPETPANRFGKRRGDRHADPS